MSIESAFGKNNEPLKKVYARLVALDLLTFFTLANSVDIKNGLKAQGHDPFDSHTQVAKSVKSYAEEVKTGIKSAISNYLQSGDRLCVTLDEWTSLRIRRYFGINVHLNGQPKGIGMMRIHGTHDAAAAEDHLRTKLKEYGISLEKHVVAHTTDGESKMISLGERLDIIHQGLIH